MQLMGTRWWQHGITSLVRWGKQVCLQMKRHPVHASSSREGLRQSGMCH